jgi:hypothetical protein
MLTEEAELLMDHAVLGRARERAGKFTLVCKRRVIGSRYLCIPVLTYYPDGVLMAWMFSH